MSKYKKKCLFYRKILNCKLILLSNSEPTWWTEEATLSLKTKWTHLQLRLGHFAALLQVQGCETVPDGLEELRPEVHVYRGVRALAVPIFLFLFLLLMSQGSWMTGSHPRRVAAAWQSRSKISRHATRTATPAGQLLSVTPLNLITYLLCPSDVIIYSHLLYIQIYS